MTQRTSSSSTPTIRAQLGRARRSARRSAARLARLCADPEVGHARLRRAIDAALNHAGRLRGLSHLDSLPDA